MGLFYQMGAGLSSRLVVENGEGLWVDTKWVKHIKTMENHGKHPKTNQNRAKHKPPLHVPFSKVVYKKIYIYKEQKRKSQK